MSKLIKLPGNQTAYVAADMVYLVKPNDYRTCIVVVMKDGRECQCDPEYGQSIYTSIDNLVAEINAALEGGES